MTEERFVVFDTLTQDGDTVSVTLDVNTGNKFVTAHTHSLPQTYMICRNNVNGKWAYFDRDLEAYVVMGDDFEGDCLRALTRVKRTGRSSIDDATP